MFLDNLKSFYSQPFKGAADMDIGDWFLFIGLFIVLVVIWNLIFFHIAEGLKE